MSGLNKKILIGLAVAVVVGLVVIGLAAGVVVYGWKAAQRAGNETAAQQDLKTIGAVEIQYYNTHQRSFGTIEQLTKEQMLSSKFARTPTAADGYIFTLRITPKTAGQGTSYALNADPESYSTGSKHFFCDSSSNIIHSNSDGPAGPNDPPAGD